MAKYDKDEYRQKIKAETESLSKILEKGVNEIFQSDQFTQYLDCMSKFHNYSYINTILIMRQNPNATLVAGFNSWKSKFKRNVNKGEKGIRIFAPVPYKVNVEEKKVVGGKETTVEKEIEKLSFRPVSVFDVSQTSGEPIPTHELSEVQGEGNNYKYMLESIQNISPYLIIFEKFDDNDMKGYCSYKDQKIVIKDGMSEAQTIKTAIHEVTHAVLHNPANADTDKGLTRGDGEIQAESSAYVVCKYFGVDTSDYSFGYVAEWCRNHEIDDLKENLGVIQKTSDKLISDVEKQYAVVLKKNKSLDERIAEAQEKSKAINSEKSEKSKNLVNERGM